MEKLCDNGDQIEVEEDLNESLEDSRIIAYENEESTGRQKCSIERRKLTALEPWVINKRTVKEMRQGGNQGRIFPTSINGQEEDEIVVLNPGLPPLIRLKNNGMRQGANQRRRFPTSIDRQRENEIVWLNPGLPPLIRLKNNGWDNVTAHYGKRTGPQKCPTESRKVVLEPSVTNKGTVKEMKQGDNQGRRCPTRIDGQGENVTILIHPTLEELSCIKNNGWDNVTAHYGKRTGQQKCSTESRKVTVLEPSVTNKGTIKEMTQGDNQGRRCPTRIDGQGENVTILIHPTLKELTCIKNNDELVSDNVSTHYEERTDPQKCSTESRKVTAVESSVTNKRTVKEARGGDTQGRRFPTRIDGQGENGTVLINPTLQELIRIKNNVWDNGQSPDNIQVIQMPDNIQVAGYQMQFTLTEPQSLGPGLPQQHPTQDNIPSSFKMQKPSRSQQPPHIPRNQTGPDNQGLGNNNKQTTGEGQKQKKTRCFSRSSSLNERVSVLELLNQVVEPIAILGTTPPKHPAVQQLSDVAARETKIIFDI